MTRRRPFGRSIVPTLRRAIFAALVCACTAATLPTAEAQTFSILHSFTGGTDGRAPEVGMRMDRAGNLYGTASAGGSSNSGVAFKMAPKNNGWLFTPLYEFQGESDGGWPDGRLTLAPDGTLYGTTRNGGSNGGGVVYQIFPPPSPCQSAVCLWRQSVLYAFLQTDGKNPTGDLTLDDAGNIYGTTILGGEHNDGAVYELTHTASGWAETVLHSFDGLDGMTPEGGVIFDQAGNLYGTTHAGGVYGQGTVFELTPTQDGWTETVLYSFNDRSDGGEPSAGLVMDSEGDLFGTTAEGAPSHGGTVFQLTPGASGWTLRMIHTFSESGVSQLILDPLGNLYGSYLFGGGQVFKISPGQLGWTFTVLHDFNGNDGEDPQGTLVRDAQGNLYGTTSQGGANSQGEVFEITP